MPRRQSVRFAWYTGLLAVMTGCAQCAPDRVADGVGALTIRNVGTMVRLLNADATCGFASPGVLAAPTSTGTIGSAGTLTYTVTNCSIDLGTGASISTDCGGVATGGSGKVTISATRTISGILTGKATSPIVPGGPDSVMITISNATFDHFEVTSSGSQNALNMLSGSISAVVKPRLAVSASTGACAVATPNVTFSNVVYQPSTVHVTSPSNTFDADVATSNLSAQSGLNGTAENSISGTMTVFGSAVSLGATGSALDPDYTPAAFLASYACTPDLAMPQSFTCADLKPRLADGAARLSVKALGTIASLMDANTTCGFSAPAVLGAGVLSGTPGDSGSLTLTATNCTLSFPNPVELSPDCSGSKTLISGTVTVSGTKVISGRFTGNALSPIVPVSDQPAVITLDVSLGTGGLSVSKSGDVNLLHVSAGTLSGTVRPRVFIGTATGVCSVSSPNADFHVAWSGANLLLTSGSGSFALPSVSTAFDATNGVTTAGTNRLTGTLNIGSASFTVPSDSAGLDPAYSQASFDAAWQCAPGLASPASSQCGVAVVRQIAGGSAALTMRTLGTVMKLVDANSSCGFSNPAVATSPSISGGGVGDDGVTATFTLPGPCTITLPANTPIAQDCVGGTTSAGGTVVVTGTKSVRGFLTGSPNPAEAIVPTSFKPAQFNLSMTFTGFVVTSSTSTSSLTVQSGTLAGTVQPRTALNPTTGACSIGTPNLTFSGVAWTNGAATLLNAGNRFNVGIGTSALAGQNGSDLTVTNTLTGSITVDGVPVGPISTPLDPAYAQAAFDATYVCAANGNPILVPNAACSFRQVLGGAAARLLAGAVSVATSVGNTSCLQPTEVISGTIGQPGSSTASATACAVTLPTGAVNQADCTGGSVLAEGQFSLTGSRSISPGLVLDVDGNTVADTIAPLAHDAMSMTPLSLDLTNWRFEKKISGVSAGILTVTGTVGVGTFTPILAEADDDQNAIGDGVFTKKTPIFKVTTMSLPTGAATLVLQGKTFKVNLSQLSLDLTVGAFGGVSNSIAGSLRADGEPVSLPSGTPFDAAFSQTALDASYTCDPKVLPVPPN